VRPKRRVPVGTTQVVVEVADSWWTRAKIQARGRILSLIWHAIPKSETCPSAMLRFTRFCELVQARLPGGCGTAFGRDPALQEFPYELAASRGNGGAIVLQSYQL